jgi:hypothetical protein
MRRASLSTGSPSEGLEYARANRAPDPWTLMNRFCREVIPTPGVDYFDSNSWGFSHEREE